MTLACLLIWLLASPPPISWTDSSLHQKKEIQKQMNVSQLVPTVTRSSAYLAKTSSAGSADTVALGETVDPGLMPKPTKTLPPYRFAYDYTTEQLLHPVLIGRCPARARTVP